MQYIEDEGFAALAVEVANTSPCQKSKRGVVIVKDGVVIGSGCNGPPPGFSCDGACRTICRDYAVHAEKNAMFDALRKGISLNGARGFHMRSVDGIGVASGTPSCVQCSKEMLAFGLAEFVLLDEKGFALYEMNEFHRLSLMNAGYRKHFQ